MKNRRIQSYPALLMLALLSGCAGYGSAPVHIGDTESAILANLGQPTARYRDGNDTILAYVHGPWGQQTYIARLGESGNLISYEQVLTAQQFSTVVTGQVNKENILHRFSIPAETSYLSLPKLEVWTYRYKENGVWDSMMHIHFDKNGIVRKMQNGPDTWLDHDERFPRLFKR
jgi:hypothetical protein